MECNLNHELKDIENSLPKFFKTSGLMRPVRKGERPISTMLATLEHNQPLIQLPKTLLFYIIKQIPTNGCEHVAHCINAMKILFYIPNQESFMGIHPQLFALWYNKNPVPLCQIPGMANNYRHSSLEENLHLEKLKPLQKFLTCLDVGHDLKYFMPCKNYSFVLPNDFSSNFSRIHSLVIEDRSIKPNSLENLTRLKELTLDRCPGWEISISKLTHLTALTLIDEEAIGIDLEDFPHLKSLDLSWCLKIRNLWGIKTLTNLTDLKLKACHQIRDFNFLSSLQLLQTLDLSYTKFHDTSLLSGLTQLTDCDLTNRLESRS